MARPDNSGVLPFAYLAAALTLIATTALLCAMIITALKPEHVHPKLHRLQRRMQQHMVPEAMRIQPSDMQWVDLPESDGLAIFDELLVAEYEREFEFGDDLAAEFRAAATPSFSKSAVSVQRDQPLWHTEALVLLRAELVMQLGFDLDIRGTVVNMTNREYLKLVDYTGFAFATIETPETYLGRYGITEINIVTPRRAGSAPRI